MSDRDKLIELIRESFTEHLAAKIADYIIQNGVTLANRTPLENVDLSLRAYHSLKRVGINTIEELREMSVSAIERLQGVGTKTMCEIMQIRGGGDSNADEEVTMQGMPIS